MARACGSARSTRSAICGRTDAAGHPSQGLRHLRANRATSPESSASRMRCARMRSNGTATSCGARNSLIRLANAPMPTCASPRRPRRNPRAPSSSARSGGARQPGARFATSPEGRAADGGDVCAPAQAATEGGAGGGACRRSRRAPGRRAAAQRELGGNAARAAETMAHAACCCVPAVDARAVRVAPGRRTRSCSSRASNAGALPRRERMQRLCQLGLRSAAACKL